jgi:dienelactone hydrolase
MRRAPLLLLAVLALAACGGGSDSKESGLAAPFAYDESEPLDLDGRTMERREGGVEVRDISFRGPRTPRLPSYLVVPAAAGQRPAVIYVHGAGGNRGELLDRATHLARRGVVGLTLEMSYSPLRAQPLPTGMEGVKARVDVEVESVQEVRRAVDLLRSLDFVDEERIGYVGWSAGARMGAIVAGVDHRIKALDLIAGGAAPLSEYLAAAPPELRAELEPVLGTTDPLRYAPHANPSALFFQNGRRDEIVPKAALTALAQAASEPKEVKWYDMSHVPSERAWGDANRWLLRTLD